MLRIYFMQQWYQLSDPAEVAKSFGVTWRANRESKIGKKLNCADRTFNQKSNRIRTKVEHAFGVVKNFLYIIRYVTKSSPRMQPKSFRCLHYLTCRWPGKNWY